MNFLGFCVSLAFLLLSLIFVMVALATNAWWLREDGELKAGLWQHCFKGYECKQYGEYSHNMLKKLSSSKVSSTEASEDEDQLDTIRGLAIFSLISASLGVFLVTIFLHKLKFKEQNKISTVAQLVTACIILLSGITGFAGVLVATNYEPIFGDIEMKLSGSWISMLMGCLLILVTGVTIAITLISAKIKKSKQSNNEADESHRGDYNDSVTIGYHMHNNNKKTSIAGNSKPNSRKASKVSALSNNDYHPFGSLQKFQEAGMCNMVDCTDDVNNNGCHGDEGEEYTIPDVGEPMTSYEKLVLTHSEDVRLEIVESEHHDVIIEDGDLSFGKLGDFSSDPLPMVMDENEVAVGGDETLTNQKRSTSFENILYAGDHEVIQKTEL